MLLVLLQVSILGVHGLYSFSQCANTSSIWHEQKWCDPSASIEDRVNDMIARMTLPEKIQGMMIHTGEVKGLGLPSYNWWEEATHGVSPLGDGDGTNFAYPITTGAAFNRTLWRATGRQIGREARAYMNVGKMGSTFWAPVVNLARDGRWGRNIETPGEDPYLSGEYGAAFVAGMEHDPDDEAHILASACCKHYVGNSVEMSTVDGMTWNRFEFNAAITQQDLVDSYMLPFQSCVEKGQVSGLMCSLNAVNGVPACADDWLIKEVARRDWGFEGYVSTDCNGYPQSYLYHNETFAATPEEGVRDMLRAGVDIDCAGNSADVNLANSALQHGVIEMDDIDSALRHSLTVRMRLSHFDPPGPLDQISTDEVCSGYAVGLARQGAAQGMVLLKNAASTLPLDATKSVAVIGPNANLSQAISGYYGARSPCHAKPGGQFPNIVDAISYLSRGHVTTAMGVSSVTSANLSQIRAAVAVAQSADVAVLVVGTDLTVAHEGLDATNMTCLLYTSPSPRDS
eukprot:TRINITY_DN43684_c0_g1_i3.p1 TRINITY_DN43684_c0_g1~~TRINITY_DN43684_c0_g1_i3.p1  ORF type:complete len:513 (+),score=82.49 TRINITY_DN43684_c0_g1_i3:35-1573(+)